MVRVEDVHVLLVHFHFCAVLFLKRQTLLFAQFSPDLRDHRHDFGVNQLRVLLLDLGHVGLVESEKGSERVFGFGGMNILLLVLFSLFLLLLALACLLGRRLRLTLIDFLSLLGLLQGFLLV